MNCPKCEFELIDNHGQSCPNCGWNVGEAQTQISIQQDVEHISGGRVAGVEIGGDIYGDVNIKYERIAEILPPPEPIRPPVFAGFVGRESELANYAEQLSTNHIAVICGMAGVGKTAVTSVLASRTAKIEDIFWHTFHPDESIQVIIWKLAGFLARHGQGKLWRLLTNTDQPPPPETLFDYLISMIRDQNYLLCFDDFQFVDEDSLLLLLVERLKDALITGDVKIIISSRRVPPFARWASTSPLQGLTIEDTYQLLATRKIDLPAKLAIDLHNKTDGNAQFLTLAIEALLHEQNPASLLEKLSEIEDIERYLMRVVDNRLTRDEREVMCAVAILSGYRGTKDAIESILPASMNLRSVLLSLSERYLLTMAEGEYGKEYGQHAIVQAYFYVEMTRSIRQERHRRAGTYYRERECNILRAARHFELAEDYKTAVKLATENVRVLINQGRARELGLLLERVSNQSLDSEDLRKVLETQGDIQYFDGRYDVAVEVLNLARKNTLPEEFEYLARIHRKLGDAFYRKGEIDKAIYNLEVAREYLSEIDEYTSESISLSVVLGTVFLSLERYEDAILEANRAMESMGKEEESPLCAADLHDIIGKANYFQGNFSESLAQFQKSFELRQTSSDAQGMIRSFSNIAVVYGRRKQCDVSIEFNHKALYIAEKIGDISALLKLYNNLAVDYAEVGQLDKAIEYYQQSLRLCEETGNTRGLALACGNLGEAYRKLSKNETAKLYLRRSVTLSQQIMYYSNAIFGMLELVKIYLEEGQLEDAFLQVQESESLASKTGDQLWHPDNCFMLALIYCAQEAWDKARSQFWDACAIWCERGVWKDLAYCYLEWATMEQTAGEISEAQRLGFEALRYAKQANDENLITRTMEYVSRL